MAEVSGCLRAGAHKLSAYVTVRPRYRLSAADARAGESVSAAGSGSGSGSALPRDRPVSVWTDSAPGVTCWMSKRTQFRPQVRGSCTLLLPPGKRSRLRAAQVVPRALSWRAAEDRSAPLHRSRTAYYDILQVSPSATQAQIKSAYYKQSFINHPDRNRSEDAARLFALIAEAYSVLGNSGLRRKYDRGILNQTDVQSAGRPADLQGQRPRRAPDADASAHFDFDAFYQAHYGEQLQREQQMRHRREQLRQQQQETRRSWKTMKMNEVTVAFLLLFGGVILISLRS